MATARPSKKSSSKKVKRQVADITVHVHASFNNTIITVSDRGGQVIVWASASSVGFKGSRKSTPFAAQVAAEKAAQEAKERWGAKRIKFKIKGAGPGRDAAMRPFAAAGFAFEEIEDVTPLPHNGCRPKKKRRA